MKWIKRILIILLLLSTIVFMTDHWVKTSTKAQLYADITKIPNNKVGLVLGTSKFIGRRHWLNPFYQYRIDAAVALFNAGKIQFILVSGDNGTEHYDEPDMMKKDLIARGIPANKIYTDYAGFRTLDSIVRCKEVFGEDHITIISQPFHNERAIFIANHKGLTAIAYSAQDVSGEAGIRTGIREKFARVKMLIDLLINRKPKYFGSRISIQ